MKVLVLFVVAGAASAWYSPVLWNVCNSAAAPGSTVVVNADCMDSINPPVDDVMLKLFYSTDGQASWSEVQMTKMSTPGYDSTYEGTFPAPSSGTVYYYVRGDNGTNFGTQSPCNSGDIWPVTDNLLAETAIEGTGDTINDPDGEFLDLTSCAMSYSGGKIYGRITNHSNQWPIRGSIIGPWYLYTVGFRNSEAYTLDTLVYAMTYGNVLGIYTTGLYEINAITKDFTKVAGIEVQTSGNRMVLRCNLSDLTARRGFQPWPNQCGYLCSAKGETRSADASLNSWQHDTTNSSRFYVNRTPRLVVGQNTPPSLTNDRVIPQTGPVGTEFWFSVRYADPDSNLPVLHAVVVGAETIALRPTHHQYQGQDVFDVRRSGFDVGAHEFRFVFNDGASLVSTTPDTFVVTDTASAVAEAPVQGPRSILAQPNPFVDRVKLTFPRLGRAIELLDAAGRRVHLFPSSGAERGASSVTLDGRRLPAGVYYLREDGGPLRRLLVKLGR
jgi:hypothetical protein